MRTKVTRFCAVVLALPLVLLTAQAALAADAAGIKSALAPQQSEYQKVLQLEFERFLQEHPEYLTRTSKEPEALLQRRDLGLLWQERARALRARYEPKTPALADAGKTAGVWKRSVQEATAGALLPNEGVAAPGPPDQNNASFSYNEVIPFEAYGVWTEHVSGLYGFPPTRVWYGGTPGAGNGQPWYLFGGINAPTPINVWPESWNPTMAATLPIGPDMYFMTEAEWLPIALQPTVSAITTNATFGGGAPFGTGSGPSVLFQATYPSWVDYPYLVVDEHPGNFGPPGLGDVHVAWVEYIDGDGVDADGNGNFFDDPADLHFIWVASANQGAGPSVYPFFFNYNVLFSLPTAPRQHQTHRPSLSVVGPFGTPMVPPSGVYAAWFDGVGTIAVDASLQPGAGAPWGALGPVPSVPVVPLPPALNGGIKSATSVSIAVDNGPMFGGMVYLAWSDYANGDADIMFSSSFDGGFTWLPPVRVNQDPLANGADQWAPHMMVDINTGEIKITYYDRRCDPSNNNIQTFASTSMDGGGTWTDWLISDAGPTPAATTLNAGGLRYIGDYLYSDFNTISGYGAIWNDGRNGGDQDVYFDTTQILAYTGDVNNNGVINAADIIYLVGHVFKGGPKPVPCWVAGDVNCNGSITAADIIYMVGFVFKSGPPPCDVCSAPPNWSCP